jgi:uncharacterized membrane-anchored protein
MIHQLTRRAIVSAASRPRAMDVTYPYWFAMLAASALGTNVGDLWAEILFPGRLTSLAALLIVCTLAVAYDRIAGAWSEVGYWIAIVAMRAAATNLADIMTHDLALGYVVSSVLLASLTLVAARFTHPNMMRGGSPRVDGPYWIAMFIAGLFGTVAGDLIHHTIGLYVASAALCAVLTGLILVRDAFAPLSVLLYWAVIMAERCAGTAVGDMLASRRAIALGLPTASICTVALILVSLWLRARFEAQQRTPA